MLSPIKCHWWPAELLKFRKYFINDKSKLLTKRCESWPSSHFHHLLIMTWTVNFEQCEKVNLLKPNTHHRGKKTPLYVPLSVMSRCKVERVQSLSLDKTVLILCYFILLALLSNLCHLTKRLSFSRPFLSTHLIHIPSARTPHRTLSLILSSARPLRQYTFLTQQTSSAGVGGETWLMDFLKILWFLKIHVQGLCTSVKMEYYQWKIMLQHVVYKCHETT